MTIIKLLIVNIMTEVMFLGTGNYKLLPTIIVKLLVLWWNSILQGDFIQNTNINIVMKLKLTGCLLQNYQKCYDENYACNTSTS